MQTSNALIIQQYFQCENPTYLKNIKSQKQKRSLSLESNFENFQNSILGLDHKKINLENKNF